LQTIPTYLRSAEALSLWKTTTLLDSVDTILHFAADDEALNFVELYHLDDMRRVLLARLQTLDITEVVRDREDEVTFISVEDGENVVSIESATARKLTAEARLAELQVERESGRRFPIDDAKAIEKAAIADVREDVKAAVKMGECFSLDDLHRSLQEHRERHGYDLINKTLADRRAFLSSKLRTGLDPLVAHGGGFVVRLGNEGFFTLEEGRSNPRLAEMYSDELDELEARILSARAERDKRR
jgi:hypothetical protein